MRLLGILLLVVFFTPGVLAQTRADKLFERGDYLGALKLYQKELENSNEKEGTEKKDLLKIRVANCFFHLNDVGRAGQLYKAVNPDFLGAEDLTFYAITLLRSGDYDKAAEQIDWAESLGADEAVVSRIRNSCDFARVVAKEKPTYSANKTKVDFAGFSAGVTYYKGRGIILSAPGAGEEAVKDSRGYRVTRLYNAIFMGDGTSGRLAPFADELADKYHIGAVTFTKDFKRIYYTRTILKKDGTSILKLMTAEEEGGKWGNVEELSINSEDYSCAHPCLYRDSLLFFVSDMPGGFGGKDIYVTEVNGAECGDIVNLGEEVNTLFDELFPFVAENGKMYFASNGHMGLGGLDVFVSQMLPDGTWSAPENMGRPINSSMDDFALVFRDTNCTDGYVSSNRGGTGYNDFLFSLRKLPVKAEPKKPVGQPKVVAEQPVMAEQPKIPAEQPAVVEQKVQAEVPAEQMFAVDYRYAIQIGAFRNPVPRVYFENFQNVKVYRGYDDIYRYTVGEYPEEHLAKGELPQVRKEVSDAFVMNVDRYVAERKIQHDVKGDDISDDVLLLRRLKNFEKAGKLVQQQKQRQLPAPRVLEKPRDNETYAPATGYTVVLMSANQVYDPSAFQGINNIDVVPVEDGRYMYCAGLFHTEREANAELNKVYSRGFKNAYVLRRNNGELFSERVSPSAHAHSLSSAERRQKASELKNLLKF